MANIITNPGAEIAAPPPIFHFYAERTTLNPYAGSYCFHLPKDPLTLTAGQITWESLPLQVGYVYPVSMFVRRPAGAKKLRARVDSGDGSYETLGEIAAGGTWTLWEPGSFEADGTVGRLRLGSLITVDGQSWYVDDVEVEGPMAKGKWDGIQGIVTLLKTIAGAPYNSDLGSRVYTRLITPEDSKAIAYPWICIPPRGRELSEPTGRMVTRSWDIEAFCFLKEDESTTNRETAAGEAASKLSDDIHAALLDADYKPNNVDDIEVLSMDIEAGVLTDYAELRIVFRVRQDVDSDDLAP